MGKGKPVGKRKAAARQNVSSKTATQLYAISQEFMESMDIDSAIKSLEKCVMQA
jgi:hypothetical protein